MLSNKEIVCPNKLLDIAHSKKGVKVAVVNAGKPLPMLSVQDAVNENLIEPVLLVMRLKYKNVLRTLVGIFQNTNSFMSQLKTILPKLQPNLLVKIKLK